MPTELLFHLDTFFFLVCLFVEDNRNITAPFSDRYGFRYSWDKTQGDFDQPVGHCEICIIYAAPPGNTNKVLYKEKKSSDSNEIMFFQNKQYTTLEVVGTENSTIQAIVFCIL